MFYKKFSDRIIRIARKLGVNTMGFMFAALSSLALGSVATFVTHKHTDATIVDTVEQAPPADESANEPSRSPASDSFIPAYAARSSFPSNSPPKSRLPGSSGLAPVGQPPEAFNLTPSNSPAKNAPNSAARGNNAGIERGFSSPIPGSRSSGGTSGETGAASTPAASMGDGYSTMGAGATASNASSYSTPSSSVSTSSSTSSSVSAIIVEHIALTQAPSSAPTAGSAFSQTPIITVEDSNNNPVTSVSGTATVTAYHDSACTNSAVAGTLSNSSATVNGGVAGFSTLSYNKTDTIYLEYSLDGLSYCDSADPVTPAPGAIASLAFSTQPSSGTACATVSPNQPVVTAYDANSNIVTTNSTAGITLTAYSDSCSTPVTSGLSATTNPVTLSSGVAAFSGLQFLNTNVAYIGASDGAHSVCSNAVTVSNPVTLTATPSNQIYPLTSNSTPPYAQGQSGAYSATTTATDQCGSSSLSYSCTYTTPGLSSSDPNDVSSATSCASLPSLVTSSGVVELGTASFSGGALSWWPTALQRGTYAFTVTATDAAASASQSTSFYVTARENFSSSNLLLALDAQDATSISGLGASIPAGPASGSDTSWLDLFAGLTGQTVASPSWGGTGTYSSPYELAFSGSTGNYMSLGSIMGSNTTMGFSTWVAPSDLSTTSSVILGNLGTSTSNSGLVLKQSDTNPGRVELQVGGGPTYSYDSTTYHGYPAVVLQDAPISYWRLDETSGPSAMDVSSNGNTGTYQNLAAGELSQAGAISGDSDTSILLNGTSQYVSTTTQYSNPQSFSLEVWFQTASGYSSGGELIGFGNAQTGSSASWDRLIYMDNSGHILFGIYSSGEVYAQTTGTYNDGNWHHAVASFTGTSFTLYVDTETQSNTSGAAAASYSGYWRIGGQSTACNWAVCPASWYFAGSVDEAAIYNYPLSSGQVTAHYDAGKAMFYPNAVLAAQPAGYWRLGERGGAIAYDSSPNGNNATYTSSGVTYGASGALTGDSNTAVTLNGSTGQIQLPSISTAVTNLSFSLWFKTTSTSQQGFLFVNGNGATNGYALYMNNGLGTAAGNQVGVLISGVTWSGVPINYTMPANTWVNFVVTQGSGIWTLYANGVDISTGGSSANAPSAGGMVVGSLEGGTDAILGTIADVAYFNYTLSPQQVSNIYNSSAFKKCATATTLANNAWSFLSGLWDGTNLELFVNGQEQCKIQPGNLYGTPSTNLYAGAAYTGSADTNDWAGQMADLKLYDITSSAAQATQFQSDFTATANRFRQITSVTNPAPEGVPDIVTSGLVLNLDAANANMGLGPQYSGGSGSCATNQLNWQDLSPSELVAGLFGFSSCSTTAGWVGSGTTVSPYALAFSSTEGTYLRVPTPTGLSSTHTVELWFNSQTASTNQYLIDMGGNNNWIQLYNGGSASYNSPTAGQWGIGGGSTVGSNGSGYFYSNYALSANTWYHAVVSQASGAMNVYIDGALVDSWDLSQTATPTSTITIGAFSFLNSYFNGQIGVVRIYSTALTQAQARQNCNALSSRFGITCN